MRFKKIFSLLLAAVMMLSGCGTAQTNTSAGVREPSPASDTDAETAYYNELMTAFREYSAATKKAQEELTGKTYDSSCYDPAEAALDKLENLSAPDSYAGLQKKLSESIPNEREYVAIMREVMEIAKKEGDRSPSFSGKAEKLNELMDKSTFPDAMMAIIDQYKKTH